jgi:hypothetical protein
MILSYFVRKTPGTGNILRTLALLAHISALNSQNRPGIAPAREAVAAAAARPEIAATFLRPIKPQRNYHSIGLAY